MKIKAISVWQPYASLQAVGAYTYETRSWVAYYRGPLLICAAKTHRGFAAFNDPEFSGVAKNFLPNCFSLPMGQAVAIVDLVDIFKCGPHVFQFTDDRGMVARQKLFGDFSPGRYAWKLENVRAIDPFPVIGRQGLFEVELPAGFEI